ncbi:molecular chaperone GrpE [Salirhabdus euzebyi]|uniref:Protein GrpE n=1 Tax=Salirhabdus euzebyi TaxID=394506 RepID=A0A841Q707_9BACI|nr:nucleotide exchange factor GrpE [Salirhabdus euzebyi]MBB6454329.1 molecular chaperone GrpE [Salirhabdus euzebyi]
MTDKENQNEQVVDEREEVEAVVEDEVIAEQEVETLEETKEQDSLQAELSKVQQEKDELYQKLLRAQADFDNFRRRAKKEREADLKYKSQELVTELLPVVDNFDRALKLEVNEDTMQGFVDGMNMVYRQLTQALEKAGVEEIKSEGEQFDPHLHQAVMQESDDSKEPNTVMEVLQKGYILKDRVIRPAMVKVNQ